jgi:hypothetical protein
MEDILMLRHNVASQYCVRNVAGSLIQMLQTK